MMRPQPARLEDIVVECRQKRSICRGAVHKRMPRWVDQASLIRIKYFESRGQRLGEDRQQVKEERSGVVGQEGQNNGCCVIFMYPIRLLAGPLRRICA